MTLDELARDQAATIVEVTGTDGISVRLLEMGLTESVSKRGQRAVCPLTNPRGLQSQRCIVRESSTLVPQSGRPLLTTVPHGSASGGKGAWPP